MPKIIQNKLVFILILIATASHSAANENAVFGPDAGAVTAKKPVAQVFTLDQAIDYALTNNPDLQIAAERIKQAEARLGM
ncbi:MAG: TolC family protein, partial [Betaproteobacteria bacterium]|nr:TolC family protein [Betaproteobacteria bacterium]